MAKKDDGTFSGIATFAFCIGLLLIIMAYIHGELPEPVQHLVKWVADVTAWKR